jgi:hypothetical protein
LRSRCLASSAAICTSCDAQILVHKVKSGTVVSVRAWPGVEDSNFKVRMAAI